MFITNWGVEGNTYNSEHRSNSELKVGCLIPKSHKFCVFSFSVAVDCLGLNNPTNGQVSLTGTTFMHTATYTCPSGFFLVGDETRTCQSNGLWTELPPECIGKSMVQYIHLWHNLEVAKRDHLEQKIFWLGIPAKQSPNPFKLYTMHCYLPIQCR